MDYDDNGSAGTLVMWITDETSDRGVEGMERVRPVRDDIDAGGRALLTELTG